MSMKLTLSSLPNTKYAIDSGKKLQKIDRLILSSYLEYNKNSPVYFDHYCVMRKRSLVCKIMQNFIKNQKFRNLPLKLPLIKLILEWLLQNLLRRTLSFEKWPLCFFVYNHLTDKGENVQKWTRVFSTRRWVILVPRTRRKKKKKIACPLLDVFVCRQVSSPRLYRFIVKKFIIFGI